MQTYATANTIIGVLSTVFLLSVATNVAIAQPDRFQGHRTLPHGDMDSGPRLAEPPSTAPPPFPSTPSLLPGSTADADKVWKCSRCGAVIGRGQGEPKIARCPQCGAKLTSWFNFYIVGGVGGALLAMLVIGSIILKAVRRSP